MCITRSGVNRLVANASKTAMLVFQPGRQHSSFQVELSGELITETKDEKSLGIHIQNDLKWSKQVAKVTSEVTYALSVLKRLRDVIGLKELRTIADGLVMSKLRYCLPIYGAEFLRLRDTDPQSVLILRMQRAQNDMLRILTRKRRRHHVRVVDMLKETKFLSINQSIAYSLLVEAWKARQFEVPILGNLLM